MQHDRRDDDLPGASLRDLVGNERDASQIGATMSRLMPRRTMLFCLLPEGAEMCALTLTPAVAAIRSSSARGRPHCRIGVAWLHARRSPRP